MKKLTKLLLIVLSYAPIATVAVAAQSKASEIEGEDQTAALLRYARNVRSRLLPDGHFAIDQKSLRQRYSKITGLAGHELEENLAQDVQFLIERGYINVDEKFLVASSVSQVAM